MKRIQIYLVGLSLLVICLSAFVAQGGFVPGEVRDQYSAPDEEAWLAQDTPLEPSPHPILSDVNIRRAVAYCTDKDALVAAAYPHLDAAERADLITDSFIPTSSWAYSTPATTYPYDPAAGQALLEAAGWELSAGEDIRMKDGKQLALILKTTQGSLRLAFMPVFEAQMRACGIRVLRSHEPGFDWLTPRDFELAEFAWVMSADDPGGGGLYECESIPGPENDWIGSNSMGWCNPEATNAIMLANDTSLNQVDRIEHYKTFIDIFAEEIPSLPLFWREGDGFVYEHIDFNLETYLQQVDVTPGEAVILEYSHYWHTQGTVDIPAGAVTEAVSIGYYPQVEGFTPAPENLASFDPFRLSAFIEGVAQDSYDLEMPITLTVEYPPVIGMQCQGCVDETTLALYAWNGDTWEEARMTCPEGSRYESLSIESNTYLVNVCHLSEFIMAGEPVFWSFFPALFR